MIENNKSIASTISKSLNIGEEEVNRVLDFVGKATKKELEGFNDIEIYIYGLGSFVARRKKIYDLMKYYEVRAERLASSQMKEDLKASLIEDCHIKIEKLRILNLMYKERDSNRKKLKDEQTTRGIQEQTPDMGRTEE